MELEHLFQATKSFMLLQMVFTGSVYVIDQMGRLDIVRSFVRGLASYVVTFGPVALLGYVLYAVSMLS
jgi:hypothetical protein